MLIRFIRHYRASTLAATVLLLPVLAQSADESKVNARIVASPEKGWPQFRGPRRDGVSDEKGLLALWPEAGPKVLWTAENLGRGYSSPIIADDRIYLTGDIGDELHIFALDLRGKLLWQAKNGAAWKGEYPAARASVTYSAGRVYHENAHGRVACVDAASGRELWAVDLLERFGGQNITWGMSECLLVDDKAVYATAGGADALAVALDKKTGAVLWKTPALRDTEGEQPIENASYASPILVEFASRHLVIGCSLRHLYCVDAADGRLQWTRRFPTTYSVISMMPTLVGNGIFMTAPHGKGGRLLELKAPSSSDSPVTIEDRWSTTLDTLQGSVVQTGGKLIGSFYGGRKGWTAISAQIGEVLYSLPDTVKGAPLLADNRIYALCEDGWMLLLEAGDAEFKVHGKFRFAEADRRDAWAHPVVAEGKLYLRFHEKLTCYGIHGQ
jgi:outer membrane protein assembly factor BamB